MLRSWLKAVAIVLTILIALGVRYSAGSGKKRLDAAIVMKDGIKAPIGVIMIKEEGADLIWKKGHWRVSHD